MTAPLRAGLGGYAPDPISKKKKAKEKSDRKHNFSSFFSIASIKDKYVDMLYRKPSQN
jgi:hypothetical protein